MTKELAQKIMKLNIDEQRIGNEKYAIRRDLGLYGWEEVCTEAMKFLIGEGTDGNNA